MDLDKERKAADAIFDALTAKGSVPYSIMNARRENSAPDYDGERFIRTFLEGEDEDFESFEETLELFEKNSVPRK